MNTALDQVPQFYSIEPSNKAIDTGQGRTYNQAGFTYNQQQYIVDQSQTSKPNGSNIVSAVVVKLAQQFLPTNINLAQIAFQKIANVGTPTGNVTITIETDNSNSPSDISLATVTYSSSDWAALSDSSETTLSMTATLTVDGATKYWIVFTGGTGDGSNTRNIASDNSAASVYSNGICQYYNGSTWNTLTRDIYFKTLYPTTTYTYGGLYGVDGDSPKGEVIDYHP